MDDLLTKRCLPCDPKIWRPMAEETANILIRQVPKWNLENEGGKMKLSQSWKVKTFLNGLKFIKVVANLAEAEGHHPDLHLVGRYNVKIDICTHAVGGLTENDFILATKIDWLRGEYY
ncbi:pterin-4-alpha-carbinolamine dehydratase 2, mitochondrial-like [Actinidia eriantha]|uniref:pterin-4-alpha-carbinolamine dehydratase 2, mitochondrial-like n=1 Tax=Actinidia eriantha TaxID=165200 RepID=UPI00258B19B2|nr:pterin-4-alpha-carbinolamine dehydratase 2, mitochondrial-like [Actinidia eriantha]XP_057463041.1 pterin-4-alpha-carbinolamine dehydratase 2, mitochondrial-like [Actinidia eriantha]